MKGIEFCLYYFDDESECITISDETDYQSFLIFNLQMGLKIPKVYVRAKEEEPLSFEDAQADLNRTMSISYIGDSEY